ncbi:MAG TPA: ribonuclease R [Dissulfurispiraceae bacterium]|nr:ribonuclease R [Dissulfurispiraceae bacterium]
MVTRQLLLSFFREKVKNPLSYRDLTELLKLRAGEKKSAKKALHDLVGSGNVIKTRKGLYGLPDEMSLVTGYFEAHRDGYGFVISEKPGERDIFVAGRKALGAMNNDRVVVRIESLERRDGRVIRILDRAHSRITGTLQIDRKASYVVPKNRSIPFDLYVAPDDRANANDGDAVVVEVVTFPTDKRPPAARVVKVLADPKGPREEVEGIIDEFHLPRRFPHDVLEEARALHAKSVSVEEEDTRTLRRKDLRALNTVTIDGERAKDFDDAISVQKTEEGFRLWVHIADVGFFVAWESPLDLEARKRGTSVYFPDRVVPMLPKELSEDLCSLKPRVDRLAFTVEMEFDAQGIRTTQRFYPSIIKSNERMTYTSVRKILIDKDSAERSRYAALLRDFEQMKALCHLIKSRRLKRGSLDFDLPEPEVLLDIQGNPESIIRAERNFAHMMIEEFMIAANEAVAEHLEGLSVPNLYRIHEEPDPLKFEEIARMLTALGIIRHRRLIKPGDVAGLLRQLKGKPEETVVHSLILRSLKQARYSPVNIGHFGLASESYSHFTSPIRRYPDLVTHRILREVLIKKRLSDKRAEQLNTLLPDIAFQSSRTERQADEAGRTVLNAMRVWYMKDKEGQFFPGSIAAVTAYGVKVRFHDVYVEGFLHVSAMTDDYYRYDEQLMCLNGLNRRSRFSVGQEITVRIERVDMAEREIILGL